MLATVFQSVLRQARRHPLYVGLNVFGLALGIGVFLTLALLVRFEYSYNAGFADADHIARMDERWSEPGTTPYENADVTFHAIPFLKEDFPQIEAIAPMMGGSVYIVQDGHDTRFRVKITDPDFLRIFRLPFLRGSAAEALARPDGLIVTRATAQTLFGTIDALGKTVILNRSGQKRTHIVTGVLGKLPAPGLLDDTQMIMPIPPDLKTKESCFLFWGSSCGNIFLKLRQAGDTHAIAGRLHDFVQHRAAGSGRTALGSDPSKIYQMSIHPLRSLHFHDVTVEDTDGGVSRAVIDSIGLIGLLALVLAGANAVNLATARAGMRAREVALRKTLGASRRALLTQFMGEALLLSLLAGLAGLALHEVLVPLMASMTGEAIRIDYGFIGWLLPLVILGSGLASGVYPALVLSGYRPAAILAATRMPSGGRRAALLRATLVTSQFAIAICVVICTLVIDRQTNFLRHADRGYVKSGLLIGEQMRTDDIGLQRRMMDVLRAVPGVTAVSFGELEPNPHSESRTNVTYNSPSGPIEAQLLRDRVSPGYAETYHPRLLAGRWFDATHGQDDGPTSTDLTSDHSGTANVILNARAAQALGFDRPADTVGRVLRMGKTQLRVIGVIADIRFGSPRSAIPPEILFFSSLHTVAFDDPVPAVRFKGVTRAIMAERLDRAWRTVRPDLPRHFAPADALMEDYYSGDERRGRLFTAGAIAALLIACLGLYGLAAFAAARRVHEIGIRKTLGASATQIVTLLMRDFLKPVLLACLIASPIAWLLMRRWLSGFDERIALGPVLFLIAILGAMLIAAGTVLSQTLRLARAEPARALRAE